jgi:hypothetical protein
VHEDRAGAGGAGQLGQPRPGHRVGVEELHLVVAATLKNIKL